MAYFLDHPVYTIPTVCTTTVC